MHADGLVAVDCPTEATCNQSPTRTRTKTGTTTRHHLADTRRGLEELRTPHDDFLHALSYRTFRLQNTDSTEDRDVFANYYKQRRRTEAAMRDEKFEGSKPIESLSFLCMFKTQCDKNAISEGAALQLLPDFLVGDARQMYQNELEVGDEEVGEITSYVGRN